jgi:hypothetical protein
MMTKAEVLKILRSNPDAAIYVWHGEVYLDDGDGARMIQPSVLCELYRDGAGDIAPLSPANLSIYVASR